jgi:hypothetical protein
VGYFLESARGIKIIELRIIKDNEAGTKLVWECALTLLADRRWREAKELFVQAIETFKRVLSNEHHDTLISMANLAATYRN